MRAEWLSQDLRPFQTLGGELPLATWETCNTNIQGGMRIRPPSWSQAYSLRSKSMRIAQSFRVRLDWNGSLSARLIEEKSKTHSQNRGRRIIICSHSWLAVRYITSVWVVEVQWNGFAG